MASTSRTHLWGRDVPDPANRQFAQVRNVDQASGATAKVGPSGTLESRTCPALTGRTWPLAWHFPPTAPDRFVHTLLLNAASALLG
ncbi:hypothetical protein [Streptomyces sp. BE133]|uniref:hypothetical protein n=1 Tax=Streptomyces sp. BE133 TaxID=3002523 RepID=UPI003FA75EB1